MRASILSFLAVVFLAAASTGAAAQSCLTISTDYASYMSGSTDGVNLYASVLLDGSAYMEVQPYPYCEPIENELSSVTHTPLVGVTLGSNNYPARGESGCPDCYIEAETDGTIANATQGEDYNCTWYAEVDCSFAGLIFNSSEDGVTIALTTTYGQNTLGSQVILDTRFCGYTPACSNSVTPTCGNPSWTVQYSSSEECNLYIRNPFIAVKVNGVLTECVGVEFPASGPGPCS